jgi:hypothetical protein
MIALKIMLLLFFIFRNGACLHRLLKALIASRKAAKHSILLIRYLITISLKTKRA